MRIIFIILINCFTLVVVYSQQLLLIEQRGIVSIVDADSYYTSGTYLDGKFSFQKKLFIDSTYNSLVGYNWAGDSLVIYLNDNYAGKVKQKKFYIDSDLQKHIQYKVNLKRIEHSRDSVSYETEKIKIHIGKKITCYKDNKLLWVKEKTKNLFNIKIISFGSSLFSPVISNNEKFVLFETNKATHDLIEIEIKTGKERVVFKNLNRYYYSPNDENILIVKKKNYGNDYIIYNRRTKESTKLDDLAKAFWLYR